MIKFIKGINTNTKTSVVVSNRTTKDINEFSNHLGYDLSNIKSNEKINTLGKLPFENLYVVTDKCKDKVSSFIADIKEEVVVLIDSFDFDDRGIERLVEKIITTRYVFDKFKKLEKNENKITFASNIDVEKVVEAGIINGNAINHTKDLVNTPHSHLNAIDLADYAEKIAKENNLDIKVFGKEEIQEMGMHAFLSVNKGSKIPPRLIYIKYQGKEKWENPTALVGKGLVFDTGGYSVKPSDSMPEMKSDMAGSAVVLGAIEAIAKHKLPVNVMVIIAATDNMISNEAYLPDDVIGSMAGKTIEIKSTDAEGRLTLCDAITFAQKEGAKEIIDIATLTGAILVALGEEIYGAFTNEQTLFDEFKVAADQNKEYVWQMPVMYKYYENQVKETSKVADLHNSPSRMGGSCGAARFLYEFVEEGTKWMHLDIAGVALSGKLATGKVTKSIIDFFRNRV